MSESGDKTDPSLAAIPESLVPELESRIPSPTYPPQCSAAKKRKLEEDDIEQELLALIAMPSSLEEENARLNAAINEYKKREKELEEQLSSARADNEQLTEQAEEYVEVINETDKINNSLKLLIFRYKQLVHEKDGKIAKSNKKMSEMSALEERIVELELEVNERADMLTRFGDLSKTSVESGLLTRCSGIEKKEANGRKKSDDGTD